MPMSLLAPETLIAERYRIIRCVGQGGMGAVYEAEDCHLSTTVALKQLTLSGEAHRHIFQREALLLARLSHPNLPRVTDYLTHEIGQFLIMDFVPGRDLDAYLRDRGMPFSPDEVLPWADQLLDILTYLHTYQPPIIHRDIKPQNIKLTPQGAIMLLDFGLAKGMVTRTTHHAKSNVVAYTPLYAPLEIIQGTSADPRSDLYSLGATLFTLLTGVPPVDAMSRAAALINGEPDPQHPPHFYASHIPIPMSSAIYQMMALRATARPPNAATARELLITDNISYDGTIDADVLVERRHDEGTVDHAYTGETYSTHKPADLAPTDRKPMRMCFTSMFPFQISRATIIVSLTGLAVIMLMKSWYGLLIVLSTAIITENIARGRWVSAILLFLFTFLFVTRMTRVLVPLLLFGAVVIIIIGIANILKGLWQHYHNE